MKKFDVLIEELQEIVDNAFALPLSGGKMVVNTERLREVIEEMRTNVPQEIRQAKNVVADRNNIIAKAKKEAEDIVQLAEMRAKEMTDRHEVTRQAQQKAADIINKANEESDKIRQAATAYVDSITKKAYDEMAANLEELKKTRQALKGVQQKNQQKRNAVPKQ